MAEKITVPTLGESVTEATVSKWLKSKGEKVSADEPLVELETDKVNVEVPSPISGVLDSISVKEGETVNVGSLLGIVNNSSTGVKNNTKEINNYSPPKKEKEKSKVKLFEEEKILKPKMREKKIEEPKLILDEEEPLILEQVHEEKTIQKSQKKISPAARKMASEAKVDLNRIEGSGKNGVILKEDIMSLMGSKPSPSERKIQYGPEERVKMTRLRLTIAKRLKEAQENAAMLTTFNEVDMSKIMSMRNQYKEEFHNKYGVKLGFMSFFVKSSVIGLKNYPDIEKNISDLGQKARDGKITIEDLQGGTFTITNGGIYGSMLSTPILNPPQSAVLGMHNIIQRPVVVDGNVEIRPIMYLALSYDHRIIDGKEAVSFLKIVKESLEQPQRLFLNI